MSKHQVKVPIKRIHTCCSGMHATAAQQSRSQACKASSHRRTPLVSGKEVSRTDKVIGRVCPGSGHKKPSAIALCCSQAQHCGTKVDDGQRCPERSSGQSAPSWYPASCSAQCACLLKISISLFFTKQIVKKKSQTALPLAGCVKMKTCFTNC